MPVPDVRRTKEWQAGTSTHREKGWTLPHPSSFDMSNAVFAIAYAISFKEICDTLRHSTQNSCSMKDTIKFD